MYVCVCVCVSDTDAYNDVAKDFLYRTGKWLQKLSLNHDGSRRLIAQQFLRHSKYFQARKFTRDFFYIFLQPSNTNMNLPHGFRALRQQLLDSKTKFESMRKMDTLSKLTSIQRNELKFDSKLHDFLCESMSMYQYHLESKQFQMAREIENGPNKMNMIPINANPSYLGISHPPLGMSLF